jgi:hypothetical protein
MPLGSLSHYQFEKESQRRYQMLKLDEKETGKKFILGSSAALVYSISRRTCLDCGEFFVFYEAPQA